MGETRKTTKQRVVFRFGQHSLSMLQTIVIFGPLGILALMVSGPSLPSLFFLGGAALASMLHVRLRVVVTAETVEVRNLIRTERFPLHSSKTEFWFPGDSPWWRGVQARAMYVRWNDGYWVSAMAANASGYASAQTGMSSLRATIEERSNGRVRITTGGKPPPWKGTKE